MIGYDEALSLPLNLYMERGEKIAMVGANGIGKTTLLKSILGLIPAVSGKVTLGDYLSIGYFEQEMAPGNTTTCIDEIWKEFPSYTQYQVEELKRALAAYKGNILLICHEPDFYEGFATKVWDCSEWSLKI